MTAEEAIRSYVEDYMGKIFYFCLKKTGDTSQAEDLSQEIALEVISALSRGVVPEHFPAWIWRLVRNRYARWADAKHRHVERTAAEDIGEYELADDALINEEYIRREELELLRRELAFISSDYRNIVVAYYIQDRSVRDIAASLSLPEGTVKTRLFRARNILKEGMNMARTFGKRSYEPEQVGFAATGLQPSGLPWRVVERQIPKNILLAASNDPMTAEELATELGIALPYMEEEIQLLVAGTLLRKLDGGKYITDFYIADKETQRSIYDAQMKEAVKRAELVDRIAEDLIPQVRKLGAVKNDMSDGEIKWWAIPWIIDQVIFDNAHYRLSAGPRANGESWGFIGMENVELPQALGMGHNDCGDNAGTCAGFYKISGYEGMWERAGQINDSAQVLLMADMIKTGRRVAELSKTDRALINPLLGRFCHLNEDGGIVPDILVLTGNDWGKVEETLKAHPLYPALKAEVDAAFDATITLLQRNSNPILHTREQMDFNASMFIFSLRMMAINALVAAGKLIVPADPAHSTVAMWMVMES